MSESFPVPVCGFCGFSVVRLSCLGFFLVRPVDGSIGLSDSSAVDGSRFLVIFTAFTSMGSSGGNTTGSCWFSHWTASSPPEASPNTVPRSVSSMVTSSDVVQYVSLIVSPVLACCTIREVSCRCFAAFAVDVCWITSPVLGCSASASAEVCDVSDLDRFFGAIFFFFFLFSFFLVFLP